MVLLIWALACAGAPCEDSRDCVGGEVCGWRGGSGTAQVCLESCSEDADCDAGQCTGKGASCPMCQDVIAYCE